METQEVPARQKWGLRLLKAVSLITGALGLINSHVGGNIFRALRFIPDTLTGTHSGGSGHLIFEFLWPVWSIVLIAVSVIGLLAESIWEYILYDRDEYDWRGRKREPQPGRGRVG